MANKVFISYRRDDSQGQAGRLSDRLQSEFGRDMLFLDVDSIPAGADFSFTLKREVSNCTALIALIGGRWLDARDERGARRLDDPEDFVRIEIAMALARDILVVPILLDGTHMPAAQSLPEDLRLLCLRNAVQLRHGSFHADSDKVVNLLREIGIASDDSIAAFKTEIAYKTDNGRGINIAQGKTVFRVDFSLNSILGFLGRKGLVSLQVNNAPAPFNHNWAKRNVSFELGTPPFIVDLSYSGTTNEMFPKLTKITLKINDFIMLSEL